MNQSNRISPEDAARYKEYDRRDLIALLYRARDCAPLDRERAVPGLTADEQALVGESLGMLNAVGKLCGIELLEPYGWWLKVTTKPNFAQFQVLTQRVLMQAVKLSVLELKSY